ncbi:hypothetical protein [Haloarchaeobius sp. DFWS5]|uniref:hypothetical protein n=1 Tax=Haloarchaeobius sp. DFWS5 TaxID=3446114 RepID=UPI003EBE9096
MNDRQTIPWLDVLNALGSVVVAYLVVFWLTTFGPLRPHGQLGGQLGFVIAVVVSVGVAYGLYTTLDRV